MIHPDIEKLYVTNEYGIKYIDYNIPATDDLIKYMKDTYNINTDCSTACKNCQINQIIKYDDPTNWAVRSKEAIVYDTEKFANQVGVLRKFQKVTVIDRRKDASRISASINYGICLRDATHPKFYAEEKSVIRESRCEECESGLSVHSKRVDGWVPFNSITAFRVKCDFFPEEYTLPTSLKQALSKEEQEFALTAIDPVRWARDIIGVDLRDHQKLDARCTAKHTIRRWGRRCLVGDTPVLTAKGSWKSLKEIRKGETVVVYDEITGAHRTAPVSDFYNNGTQDVWRLKLRGGLTLKLTNNHPLLAQRYKKKALTYTGFQSIEDGLSVGDRVAVTDGWSQYGNVDDPNLGMFLGFMITDGSCVKGQSPKFTNNNSTYIDWMEDFAISRFKLSPKRYKKGNGQDIILSDRNHGTSNPVVQYFKELGIYGLKASRKKLPKVIYDWNRRSLGCLVNAMLAGDGNVSTWFKGRGPNDYAVEIALSTASIDLANDFRLLLLKEGIYARITTQHKTTSTVAPSLLYKVCVNNKESIVKLLKWIGPVVGKEDACQNVLEKITLKSDKGSYPKAEDGIRWFKIQEIEYLGKEQTYDITVPKYHNFIANGIVSHNSGKTFSECYQILKYCMTEVIDEGINANGNPVKRGPVVLIASPFLAQISLIFDQIQELIARNPDITIKRAVKTPFHQIELEGPPGIKGAIIKGFTTGSQSKQEASTLRGQSSDMLLLDEVDAMPEDDILKAIQPIQLTSPNVQVMASSTPMGKQEWFWKTATQSPHYRETYFPSTVLDHWDQIKDELETEGSTDERFRQEYLAEFIAQIEGLYQPQYIAQAELAYEYGQTSFAYDGVEYNLGEPNPEWIYSVGVDWNTNAGVEIVVVGLPRGSAEWWVVDCINVPKQDYQQHKAMEVIVDVNRKWDPRFIYVDRGYGATQYESLQAFSEEAKYSSPGSPDARLGQRLKAYDFGSKIEYRNPANRKLMKQPAKPFLIENSVRQFEQGRIRFSYKDYMLHKQLLNYIRIGFTPSGLPKYGMNDPKVGDHRLDALNLALIAYILEMSDYGLNTGGVTSIGYSPGFGKGTPTEILDIGEKRWIEFAHSLPEGSGVPGRLKVRYEPGYLEMKAAERYNNKDKSRTSDLDDSTEDRGELRIGFNSDTEYKHKKKKPGHRTAKIRKSKPKRRTI